MAVTELAILRLTGSPDTLVTPTSPLRSGLAKAKSAMEKSSRTQPFHYFQCIEDPSVVYIIGSWPSVDYHVNEWIPSPENQGLLALLGDLVTVEAMFHLDIDRGETPIPGSEVVAIGRHFVKGGEKVGFEGAFRTGRKHLDGFAGQGNVVGGWRIDGMDEGKHEFVLFSGWDSVERHMDFAKTKGFSEYRKIGDFVERFEVKHARMVNIEVGEC